MKNRRVDGLWLRRLNGKILPKGQQTQILLLEFVCIIVALASIFVVMFCILDVVIDKPVDPATKELKELVEFIERGRRIHEPYLPDDPLMENVDITKPKNVRE